MTALAVVFWVSVTLLVYTHLGYPVVLWALARGRPDDVAKGQPARTSLCQRERRLWATVRPTMTPSDSKAVAVIIDPSPNQPGISKPASSP